MSPSYNPALQPLVLLPRHPHKHYHVAAQDNICPMLLYVGAWVDDVSCAMIPCVVHCHIFCNDIMI